MINKKPVLSKKYRGTKVIIVFQNKDDTYEARIYSSEHTANYGVKDLLPAEKRETCRLKSVNNEAMDRVTSLLEFINNVKNGHKLTNILIQMINLV